MGSKYSAVIICRDHAVVHSSPFSTSFFFKIMFGETINLLFRRVPNCEDQALEGVDCDVFNQSEADDMRQQSFELAIYWAIIAVGCVVGNMLLFYGFGMASERLNKRVGP
jgi:ATP-binding cassette subfamily B (MDR/TAP) protein 1